MGHLYELSDKTDALRYLMRKEVTMFKRGFIMLISAGRKGKMGCGKSHTAVNIAMGLDKHFTIDDVCFTASEFQSRIRDVERKHQLGRVLILDEAQTAIPAAEYMSYINKTIFYILSTFRHLRIIVILVTPSMGWVDKRIRMLIYLWGTTAMDIGPDGKRVVYLSVSRLTTDFIGETIYPERLKFYNTKKHKPVYCKKFKVMPLPKEMRQIIWDASNKEICPYSLRHSRHARLAMLPEVGLQQLMSWKGSADTRSINPYLMNKPNIPRRID